jgi:hypothetical protein
MHRLLLLLAACSTRPAPAAPTPTVPLAGELTKLAWYVGDWSCEGTQFATKDEPESKWKAEVHVRGDAGGGVAAIHMIGPGDNSTAEIKGYDPTTKRWYHVWSARDGSHGTLTATGWEGESMTAVDDADPKHRTVMTKLGADRYSHRDEQDAGEGFKPVWEKVCSREPVGSR